MVSHSFVGEPIGIRWLMFPFTVKLVASFDGINNLSCKPRAVFIANVHGFSRYMSDV